MELAEVIDKIEDALGGVIEYSGEVMLLDWSKSTCKDGPKVKFLLPDDQSLAGFEMATIRKGKVAGQIYHLIAIKMDDVPVPTVAEQPETVGHTTSLAQKLMKDGYFRNQKLWSELMDEREHLDYIRSQPCCYPKIMGGSPPCDGDVVAHHVRTAENSGVGIKPSDFLTVPLCHRHHHDWAHNKITREERESLLLQAVKLSSERCRQTFKSILGLETMSDLTQDMLDEFEQTMVR